MNISTLQLTKVKENQLRKKGIETIKQLIEFFPRDYHDFSRPIENTSLAIHEKVQAFVLTATSKSIGHNYGKVIFMDSKGYKLSGIWFNANYIVQNIKENQKYIIAGKVKIDSYGISIVSPILISTKIEENKRIYPIYSKVKGMSEDFLTQTINNAILMLDRKDILEPFIASRYKLPSYIDAIKEIHSPTDEISLAKAKKRIIFNELFFFNLVLKDKERIESVPHLVCNKKTLVNDFIDNHLKFKATNDQLKVFEQIYKDMSLGKKINALIQGDVGTGKTLVAMFLSLLMVESGFQTAIIAPTTVLAEQHYNEFKLMFNYLNLNIAFLNGSTKTRERNRIIKGLANGEISIVIGTHAILSESILFKNIGLSIIDEEHRFGVTQRNKINKLNKIHNISMSATPIPRTLAMTVYGASTDIYTIKEKPSNRIPIRTFSHTNKIKIREAMTRQIKEGRQCYVVCPLVEESSSEKLEGIESVEETTKELALYYQPLNIKVESINGKMKAEEVNEVIERFKNKEFDILVATTIIEVGVNVPNASVIVIKHAERFGLAQLHQLRGRVGRGSYAGYCVLYVKDTQNPRIKAMIETNDGFIIAEKDLELRGAGTLIGDKQSGINQILDLIKKNPTMYESIEKEIDIILTDKKRLSFYRNQITNTHVNES